CAANRQAHRDQAGAVLRISGIETRLIEVEFSPVVKAIKERSRFFIQPEHVQPQPAALQSDLAKFAMEGRQRGQVKGVRSSTLAPARVVLLDQLRDRLLTFVGGADRVE